MNEVKSDKKDSLKVRWETKSKEVESLNGFVPIECLFPNINLVKKVVEDE
jgi:hypothetical protein